MPTICSAVSGFPSLIIGWVEANTSMRSATASSIGGTRSRRPVVADQFDDRLPELLVDLPGPVPVRAAGPSSRARG